MFIGDVLFGAHNAMALSKRGRKTQFYNVPVQARLKCPP